MPLAAENPEHVRCKLRPYWWPARRRIIATALHSLNVAKMCARRPKIIVSQGFWGLSCSLASERYNPCYLFSSTCSRETSSEAHISTQHAPPFETARVQGQDENPSRPRDLGSKKIEGPLEAVRLGQAL